MSISGCRCLDFLYNVSCVLFPLPVLGDITTVGFSRGYSLTAEMSVKHSVTVPCLRADLTALCALCHAGGIWKLLGFLFLLQTDETYLVPQMEISNFFCLLKLFK